MKNSIEKDLLEHVHVIREHQREIIEKVSLFSRKILSALKLGNKVIFAGNGGSAADSQHLAAEFVGRFKINRDPMASVALTTNTSILTAIGNDFGFDKIFSRQIDAIGKPGDIFVPISTSGNSENLIVAARVAREKKMFSWGFLGKDGGQLREILDDCIVIVSENTPRIQEMHIMIGHIICDIVEKELYGQ